MRDITIAILVVLVAFILVFTGFGQSSERVYNCELAEFHPDYPEKVKEACRKLRRENTIEEPTTPLLPKRGLSQADGGKGRTSQRRLS